MQQLDDKVIALVAAAVKDHVRDHWRQTAPNALFDVDHAEAVARAVVAATRTTVLATWAEAMEEAAVSASLQCPGCGARRKTKRNRAAMKVRMLGTTVKVPKPYLECGRCETRGVSAVRLLSELSSGAQSGELQLMAGYLGAEMSYGRASRDLQAHYGEPVERTAVRRMALEVEQHAIAYAREERDAQLSVAGQEQRREGEAQLMMQADGGTVRVSTLQPCERGDPGFGQLTPKTRKPRQKKETTYREIITMDVRVPGEVAATALDILVPNGAPEGERARRMLALATRKGLGDNTKMFGLGDMGSSLASSFDEAFVGHKSMYSADWKHTTDYVDNAALYLTHKRPGLWAERLKDALWERDRRRAMKLIASAEERRVSVLPDHLDKCPVATLRTYVTNNWDRFHAKAFKEAGLDFVSARAESQVRDRTKARFRVAGSWKAENLDGKATLRAIIADGRWPAFRDSFLAERKRRFDEAFASRVHAAISAGTLHPESLLALLPTPEAALAA